MSNLYAFCIYLSVQERRKNTISCGLAACRKRQLNNPQPGDRVFARLDGDNPWSKNQCGVEASSNLIHQEPWLVFLEYWMEGRLLSSRCAATLIDEWHLVTAAHCVNKPNKFSRLVARLGEYDLSTKKDCRQGVCTDPPLHIEVEDIILNPNYKNHRHDIAILRLKKAAPYTDFIRPICLPTGPTTKDMKFSAGAWGEIPYEGVYSKVKKIVLLPNVDIEVCAKAYPNADLGQDIICAGGERGIDTCRGDSGSPLVLYRKQAELRGVTSGGNSICGIQGYPGIYTDVSHHLNWIKEVTRPIEIR
ncbi:hypothetical protein K1T71_012475 [Dendrolimus kikuchii]|uniref:Uncharacterized protein n=1 Tax=Dendrolimus kikuchii TaxID=765133 RepID=A0ACC1CJT1_9NEOP|nr:hypothetical protein K1T71_012475 [Dendrolimus kikuchii]